MKMKLFKNWRITALTNSLIQNTLILILKLTFSYNVISLDEKLPSDLEDDRKIILERSIPLVQGMVDVIASNRWLNPALASMELSQMITQGLWDKDPILMQLPHFSSSLAKKCSSKGVESVFDLMELDDSVRRELLGLSESKLNEVASVCNKYPNINVEYHISDKHDIRSGHPVTVQVSLTREISDSEPIPKVHSPLFPKEKDEGWWLVIGDPKKNQLYAIKRLNIQRKAKISMEYVAPKPGRYSFNLYLMSDCYLGCDQEYQLEFESKEGDDDDDED
eukprot:NODE_4203_length_1207_cov_51.729705_g3704_i0.p1 GENE.NODE_4203_length_1207_cov_51.729705_g3704_i0~~NODE_4203_length_1207_cov_51.729705_g3704_i0.p1  ORF type:complete len:278 (-),score=43.62 NODE_4203_length_1207_cov_51.729705_g3704_i0:111-944(-)